MTWWVTGGLAYDNGVPGFSHYNILVQICVLIFAIVDLQTTETYSSGSFSAGRRLPMPLRQHCIAYFESNTAIVTGGYGSSKAFVYDFTTQTFANLTDMNEIRFGHTCYRVESGTRGPEIVVAGGFGSNTVEVYNLGTEAWTYAASIPASGTYAANAVPHGDSFAVVGGEDGSAQVDTVYLYNKETKGWSVSLETLATARIHSVAVAVPDALANC